MSEDNLMWQDRKHLDDLVLRSGTTITSVMRSLDAGGVGVVYIVGDDHVLKGILTDGDVRRALLAGAQMTDPADDFVNASFISGRASASRAENLSLMSSRILHLPILDDQSRLVDVISWKDLWHVPLVSPSLAGNELKYVEDCIATGWVSSQGPYIQRFEESVRTYVGVEHSLSVSNCTQALQLALQALDVGPGDEVIVPDFTFGASANAILQRGAQPVFVDVDPATWTLDPHKAAKAVTSRTKAMMPVHIYGHPCDMDPLMDIARQHGLKVVEDCAEALGALYKGRPVGSIGDVGCFSFFANKIITTGEGGMITCNDEQLAARLKMLRDHGTRADRRYWHIEAGTNCRMTNLQAAVGLAQMERIEHFLAWRDRLAARYDEELYDMPGIRRHATASWARKVCWLYTVVVNETAFGMNRDELLESLKQRGIESRPTFPALHPQPAYQACLAAGSFASSELLGACGISLPTGNETPLIEVLRVTEEMRALMLSRRQPARSAAAH
jgi:perosamine synthetase